MRARACMRSSAFERSFCTDPSCWFSFAVSWSAAVTSVCSWVILALTDASCELTWVYSSAACTAAVTRASWAGAGGTAAGRGALGGGGGGGVVQMAGSGGAGVGAGLVAGGAVVVGGPVTVPGGSLPALGDVVVVGVGSLAALVCARSGAATS